MGPFGFNANKYDKNPRHVQCFVFYQISHLFYLFVNLTKLLQVVFKKGNLSFLDD